MQKTIDDIRNITEARVDFYLREIREKDNEWILEEMHEFYDEVNTTYYLMWKAGVISQDSYQSIASIPMEGWSLLHRAITNYESRARRNNDRVGRKYLHALVQSVLRLLHLR